MKKSIIALAVAGALTAPMIAQADATLYGVAQYRGIATDNESFQNNMAKTRLGVKGTVDNDVEGLTTGFQFEWEFKGDNQSDTDMNMRKSLVYLKGDFGQVTFGSQNNPLNDAESTHALLGRHGDQYGQISDRVTKAVSYVTPKMAGAELYVAFTADGAADTNTDAAGGGDFDSTIVGFNWSGAGFSVHGGIQDTADVREETAFGVSYTGIENLTIGASIATDENEAKTSDVEVIGVGVAYTMGKVTLLANVEQYEDSGSAANALYDEQTKIGVGVSYALGAKAALAVEYFDFDSEGEADYEANGANAAGHGDTLVLQYTLSF